MSTTTTLSCVCLTLMLTACGQSPMDQANAATSTSPVEQAASNKQLAESFGTEFEDTAEAPQKPSYEVAIATAAADQTQGIEACKQKPVADQKACKQEVDKTWADAAKAAESSRGNQQ
ncbi:MAG: hypothetical protein ABI859_01885 [Pseudomonadota bacterium]